MNKFGIEILPYQSDSLRKLLESSPDIYRYKEHVYPAYPYGMCAIWVDTTLTPAQFEAWLSAQPGLHYISVFERREIEEINNETPDSSLDLFDPDEPDEPSCDS
jgi:hypothetical protein